MSLVEMLFALGAAAAAVLAMQAATWLLSLRLRDAGVADVAWGLLQVACVWIYFGLTPDGWMPRKIVLALLVTAWGVRLSWHVWRRSLGRPEDARYRRWREEAGAAWWWRSLFFVFVLQGALACVLSVPLMAAQAPTRVGSLELLAFGIVCWLIGFVFEACADWQLERFRRDPSNAGRVLDSGLWRYSRHPNYFGEAVQWWGIWLVACSAGAWWTVFAPILLTSLLLRVSGVPLLERDLRATRPGYADYVARTSAFFPWVPKGAGSEAGP